MNVMGETHHLNSLFLLLQRLLQLFLSLFLVAIDDLRSQVQCFSKDCGVGWISIVPGPNRVEGIVAIRILCRVTHAHFVLNGVMLYTAYITYYLV